MSKVYAVLLHIDEKNLPTVLSAVAGSATLVSVTATIQEPAVEKATPREFHYAHGKRDKGISGEDLVLEVLAQAGKPVTLTELEAAFVERRFSHNSVSPIIHKLLAAEKIRRVGTGSYCLPGTFIKMGAGAI